ncbi:hypothetical protein P5V19_16820 [Mycobacteroides abscessus subsp. abscessus]|uniref:hypothetical protein n=1 Tax=Mycobacteroides abscessus TaxID=36809 RepID=UPI002659794E|nr:hypothetical protein [Mycobacteroides abscessus]MDO3074754.1 hypothetical protein [Mycobacteroides abscessus subsp. abscessus]MDO3288251.1 hypothetical protein [Mycobacteroides abscessus subsp. abscessus]MDO3296551.1 hypothetical protein [Mycobacteroides abscessus subsp. abscessus]WKE39735.1 hypothetical protein P3M62_01665 [Mycobacteroides abscessus subsp. abscessus]
MPVDPAKVTSLTQGDVTLVVPLVTRLAKSYTRGRGFDDDEPNPEIAAVIVTASARLAANGNGLWSKQIDDVKYEYARFGFGWTLGELAVLNRYRKRAM